MQNYGHEDYDYGVAESQQGTGRALPQVPGARPMVDPHAQGEVDPNLYPQPKEATHKIRGKSDVIEYLFGSVDQELLTVKTFYFFFYIRPLIEFLSAPFWGSLADRWQKGKMIFIASLSCWIIFTLPLAFMQPPATSCMVVRNSTVYLEAPNPKTRIVKRSTSLEDFYHQNDEECLEIADNVVFERLRKDSKLDPLIAPRLHRNKGPPVKNVQKNYSLDNNRVRRNTEEVATTTEESPVEDLKYKQLVFEENNPEAKTIDFETLQRKNRPADVLEYKRFLNNQPLDDEKPPKKAYTNTKTRVKSPPTKVMVKRDIDDEANDENKSEFKPQQQWSTMRSLRKVSLLHDEKDDELHRHAEVEQHVEVPVVRTKRYVRIHHSGQSPHTVVYAVNYDERENKGWVKPLFSSIVYRLPDIQKTFFLLLLLVVVGEFFSAPAITLADSAVITLLGEDADRYGHQRMFGSLGWGLAMFFVGIALDHSTAFSEHPCGPDIREKNYTICFAIFSVLMGAALITATQINFKYDFPVAEPEIEKPPAEPTREEQLQSQLSQQLNLPSLQDSSAAVNPKPQPPEGKTKMFAQTIREIPEWVTVLKQFQDLKCASFLFVAWFMGFGIGLIFTFLFWHLQDYGGTPTLFGVASVINHISEIFAYFFSFKLIRQIGHVKVLCMGLGGNVLRFLYISWLKSPWWVLPFEFIQGITHAAVWAACCSYISHNTPPQLRTSAQGVLQGIHHGLGRGCGAVIGGMFVDAYGTTATFRAYGLICILVLAAFVFINFYRKDTGFVSELPQTEDPHQVAEATHLAPHGVPSNAIPRALSSTRLHELANQDSSYGATYQTSGGNLGVPGANGGPVNPTNPFLNSGGGGGGGYNYGMTGNGEDEYIRRSFQLYNEVINREFDLIKPPPIVTHLHAQQPCTNPFHQHDYEW
ncbi:Major facilitator superfamily domain-containing protein 6 [Eufriesea mexicana]|uniref:Major facilitator superfamily domain-containing protein 6 n=1 Tax=Eufriesea mexicana TaxID=516756 RepID=A0A310SKM1_9HYME|nr:PREDICTED: major facilitator superfamily domain-containing protein 6 [Eufriesea mexicana]OAD54077.1 Major facilitator superfamily domain-containing protein 6 [Eufriesea mexicana]